MKIKFNYFFSRGLDFVDVVNQWKFATAKRFRLINSFF